MPIIGPNPVTNAAGVAASQRAADRAGVRRDAGRRVVGRGDDDALIASAESLDPARAVRALTSNEQEDAREDHEQTGTYSPGGAKKPIKPRLDVNG